MMIRWVYRQEALMSQYQLLCITPTGDASPAVADELGEIPEFTVERVTSSGGLPAEAVPSSVDCVLVSDGFEIGDLKETIGVARDRWTGVPVVLVVGEDRLQTASEEILALADDCLCEGVNVASQIRKHRLLSTIEMTETQAKLHRHRDLLRRSQDLANIGAWEYDIEKESLRWTEQVYEIHDLPLEYEPVVDEALGFYHTKDLPEIEAKLETLLETGTAFQLRVRIVTATGTVKWVRVCGDAEVSDGRTRKVRGTIQEITDSIEQRNETERLRRNLEEEKERIERLSSVLAHELRNPLTVIDGQLKLYRERGDSSHLDAVERHVERLSDVIEDTLWLVRENDTVSEMSMVDVPSVAEDAWQAVGDGTASLRTESMERIPANESLLQTTFEKLFDNALEHTDASQLSVGPLYMGDDLDGFYVADDGSGFDTTAPEEIFEIDINSTDGSSGIGLPVVKEIVQRHRWSITLAERDTPGARFEIKTGIL